MNDPRAEGVYAKWIKYPPEPLIGSTDLFQIEYVNGNQTVTSIVMTCKEFHELYQAMTYLKKAKAMK